MKSSFGESACIDGKGRGSLRSLFCESVGRFLSHYSAEGTQLLFQIWRSVLFQ